MPVYIKDIVFGIRDLLGMPDYRQLPNYRVLLRTHDKIDYYQSQIQVATPSRYLNSSILHVDPLVDEVAITAANFGRPVLAHTYSESDPDHQRREVELLSSLQSMDLYYLGSPRVISTTTEPHVASSIAIYYDQTRAGWFARITPQHSNAADYLIWHQSESANVLGLNDVYRLPESFTNLLKTDTALSLWPVILTAENGTIASAVREQLQRDFELYNETWQVYKQQSVVQQLGKRRGFFGGRYCDDEVYY